MTGQKSRCRDSARCRLSAPRGAAACGRAEAEGERAAPVLIGGEPIIWITTGVGPYTPQFRADRISQRLQEAIHDRSLRDPTVTVTEDGRTRLNCASGPGC